MLDLALGDQVLERAGNLLDRHVGIDAVLVEDVDAIGAQAPEGGLGDLLDMLRPAVETAAPFACRRNVEAELGCDHHLITNGLQRLPDQLLVDERTI